MPDLRALFDDLARAETGLWDAVDRRLRRDLDLPLGSAEVLRVIATTVRVDPRQDPHAPGRRAAVVRFGAGC